ncbi:MAG: ABC transporter permease [Clostridioides sp.]|nr:ABC transporter permease [Clostridioides sp.]
MRKKTNYNRVLTILKGTLIFLIILALWEFVTVKGVWTSYILPSPSKVWKAFLKMSIDGSLIVNIYTSMRRVVIGFTISSVLAIPMGIFFGLSKRVYEYFKPLLDFLRNTPPLALIPMLILWFGIGEKSKIIVIILASFFPVFANTLKGIRDCDPKLIEVGRIFELSKIEIIFKIIIPSAILDIATGLKLALGYSFRAIIGAELIAASSGLGYLISDGKEMSRTDVVIVGIIVIGVLGIITDQLFTIVVKRFTKGKAGDSYD